MEDRNLQTGMSSQQAQIPDVQWYGCCGCCALTVEDWGVPLASKCRTCESVMEESSKCSVSFSGTYFGGTYAPLMIPTQTHEVPMNTDI